jgi:cytochrome c oxidase subunit II
MNARESAALLLMLMSAGVLGASGPTAGREMRAASNARAEETARVVSITAKRYEFTPNVVTLKKGETVVLELSSEEVQHGFYVRGLKVDEDIHPGQKTRVTITPDKAGTFDTICDHICGPGHKNMKMTIVVEE